MNLNPLRRIVTLILRRPKWHPTQLIQQTRLRYQIRQLSLTVRRLENESVNENNEEGGEGEASSRNKRDKRLQVDVDTSIRYMTSEAFEKCYKNDLVWTHYRRNFRGPAPVKTRETCVRGEYIATGSPCPICRDEYLVVDYRNIKLIEHFTDPVTGELYDTRRTGVCQKQHRKLQYEKFKAMEYGLMEANMPFRHYNNKFLDDEFGILSEEIKEAKISDYSKWRAKRAYARENAKESKKSVDATNQ